MGYEGVLVEVPDPVFALPAAGPGRSEVCRQAQLPADRPMVGVAVSREYRGMAEWLAGAREAGYLPVGLSMHCPLADVQRGHVLDPMQWFHVIGQCDFLVTDRFHATVAAMIHSTPLVCLQAFPVSRDQSKIWSVLDRFELGVCHMGETLPSGSFPEVAAAIRERFDGGRAAHEECLARCRAELQNAARQLATVHDRRIAG